MSRGDLTETEWRVLKSLFPIEPENRPTVPGKSRRFPTERPINQLENTFSGCPGSRRSSRRSGQRGQRTEFLREKWCRLRDSNTRPHHYE